MATDIDFSQKIIFASSDSLISKKINHDKSFVCSQHFGKKWTNQCVIQHCKIS
jgi:hypothetical protein